MEHDGWNDLIQILPGASSYLWLEGLLARSLQTAVLIFLNTVNNRTVYLRPCPHHISNVSGAGIHLNIFKKEFNYIPWCTRRL